MNATSLFKTRLFKESDLQLDPHGKDPRKSTLARAIGPDVSQTLGAGMATFDKAGGAWTVPYDEIIV